MPQWLSRALFAVPVTGLVGGLALAVLGRGDAAALVHACATAAVLVVLLGVIVVSLAHGRFGLDIIAALSMGGALLVGEPLAGNVVALMFSGGQLLEDFAQSRAARDMTALLSRVPREALVHRPEGLVPVPLAAVLPGDRVMVRPGDVVPVDGAVLEGSATLDESALTGESLPVRHAAGEQVMSGSTNRGGGFDVICQHTAADSTYAGIVRLVAAAQQSRAPMARLADRWAIAFLVATCVLAGGTWLFTQDVVRTLAVLVVATPCPLILAVPVAIVAGLSRCAANGILVKGGGALEILARVRTLLVDKTGTITSGTPVLVAVEPQPGVDQALLFAAAAGLAQGSAHAISAALAAEARHRSLALPAPSAVVEEAGAGLAGIVGGQSVHLGSAAYVEAHVGRGQAYTGADGSLTTYVGIEGHPAGRLVFADTPRPEAAHTLAAVRRAGIGRIVLLTGDRAAVAHAVAEGLGFDRVVADATPAQKVAVVTDEATRGITAMVGDGVNDAPALAAAAVGVAMGVRGAAASAEAADIVLLVDSLDRLPIAMAIAQRTRAIALQSVMFGMALSIAAMAAAAMGFLSPLHGALLQEVIDVAVILNALRALRAGTPTAAGSVA
ncbi:MAG: heavy metal translocating P-type ATPase [Alsobacter sp.]